MYQADEYEFPMEFSWIGNWSKRRAMLTPDREAIYDNIEDKRYTFKDLDERANKTARFLRGMGIEKGDRVGIFSTNRIEMIDLFFAVGKIGAVLVPFNVRLTPNELEYLIEKTSPSVLFYESKLNEKALEIKEMGLIDETLIFGDEELNDDRAYSKQVQPLSGDPIKERPTINFEDPYLILFTGGTTGLPKGAVLSHRLVFWNSVNTILTWGLRPDDVQPLLFPLFHTGGWNVLLNSFFHQGAKSILMGDFDPVETLHIIEEEECTIVIAVPTMYHVMANQEEFKTADFSSVRVFISGGAPCPVSIMENYWDKGKPFKMGYGLTEVGPNNFFLPIEDIKEKPTSVGLPVFHCDMKIVNEDGEEVKQGDVGELLLKGPHIFSGYWDEPEETKETIEPDGYVHTGDLAKQDDDGYYYIVGRKKEMFISGGENVFPVEIEEILYKNPAIDEAAVIGVPDEKWGEVGKAFITLKKGKTISSEEVKEFLSGKLSKYKIPKYIEIRDSLPTSGTGKILKRELEEEEGL